ncbi:hypothetical protein Avbf_12386 [Armadillidium vulgare]|nr:hypothetical protein Avbf_12386 [Armadillidium vulgare]
MQNLMYISNGVQLEIDRVTVVPLEILNRHCRNFRKIPIGNRQFRILIHPISTWKKIRILYEFSNGPYRTLLEIDVDPVQIFCWVEIIL